MIKVTVKYYTDTNEPEEMKHVENYTIKENISAKDSPQLVIKKEVAKIFKKYKGIYCIKFYV